MPDANAYLDLSDLANVAEQLPEDIETNDFITFKTMPVGNYISQSRKITGKKNSDGHLSFAIVFEGGLQYADNGGKVYAEKYPLKKWITTIPYQRGDTPGKTSGVAEYLRAAGFNPKGMNIETVLTAMLESQTIPVSCFVGRTDRRIKNETTGEWSGGKLNTKDFLLKTMADGTKVYAEQVEKDGQLFRATPAVLSFSVLR